MIKVGDKVKVNEKEIFFIGQNLFDVIEIKDLRAMIKNNVSTIFCLIENLELVESKKDEVEKENKTVVFTGKEIELDNKLGAIAEIYYGYNEQKKKCICVDIKANNTITAFFNNLDEVNLFLKSLGFKEILEEKFNLVEFLKENLKPKEFEYGVRNRYISYEHDLEEFEYKHDYYNEDIGTVYIEELEDYSKIISELTINEVTPQQLKEAYKTLGWL